MNLIKLNKQKKLQAEKVQFIEQVIIHLVSKKFGRNIYNGGITLKEADGDQRNLFVEILNFQDTAKPQEREKKTKEKRCP